MRRVKFSQGGQRVFLKLVLEKLNCPSLRSFEQFGFDIPYSTLKNYFNESRLLPFGFFKDLCALAHIEISSLSISYLDKYWGQVKGGMNNGPTKDRTWVLSKSRTRSTTSL